ncbi:MAG: hypothetical protein NTV32_02760 [Gammaproteobacteria bacterium]|jgi:hypothetical protein|nr:hypothetical protein [Gammaproteobacteria bacterium]
MKKLKLAIPLLIMTFFLSGCIAMWVGGGAAGGYYGAKHYTIEKTSP